MHTRRTSTRAHEAEGAPVRWELGSAGTRGTSGPVRPSCAVLGRKACWKVAAGLVGVACGYTKAVTRQCALCPAASQRTRSGPCAGRPMTEPGMPAARQRSARVQCAAARALACTLCASARARQRRRRARTVRGDAQSLSGAPMHLPRRRRMCGPVGEGLAACLVGVACSYTKAVTRPKLRRHPEIAGGVTMEWSHATRKSRGG